MTNHYGYPDHLLKHYTCLYVNQPFPIDGNLDKFPWNIAPKSTPFVDMVTGAPAFLETCCASLWDHENLYIAFWIEEPDIRAQLTQRDSRVYLENDIEVFISGNNCYYEFQVNALNTIYEVFYIWQDAYKKESRFAIPEFDLLTHQVDVIGGFQDNTRYEKHPRGRRWAFMDWDFPGLVSAVKINGTINNPSDIDQGWTVELAFPWKGMTQLFLPHPTPQLFDKTIRIDLSRFEKITYNGFIPAVHPGWSLNPHGVYDSHIPESFSYFHLSNQELT